jgi:SMI1 / KNR4 family (SUKH-1)
MRAHETLLEMISRTGGETYPPATLADIVATECRMGFSLPGDLRAFYLRSNGASLHDWMREIYPVSKLEAYSSYRNHPLEFVQITRTLSLRSESLIFFADILIDAPSYWICCDPESLHFGYVFSDGDTPGWEAADSFITFIEKMAADIENIFIGID